MWCHNTSNRNRFHKLQYCIQWNKSERGDSKCTSEQPTSIPLYINACHGLKSMVRWDYTAKLGQMKTGRNVGEFRRLKKRRRHWEIVPRWHEGTVGLSANENAPCHRYCKVGAWGPMRGLRAPIDDPRRPTSFVPASRGRTFYETAAGSGQWISHSSGEKVTL